MLFSAYDMKPMAALALTAALYHVASHAFFKSLLFVGTGAVLHATGQRSLGKLGGLIRYMPWVAWLTLVGTLASAGLPPLGGFVSEWLLLQSFLFTPGLPSSFLNMLIPIVAALIALVAALSGYTMVKFFGVIFLGQPREDNHLHAHRAGTWERIGMVWLALGCIALGLLPVQFIQLIDTVTRQLVAAGLGSTVRPQRVAARAGRHRARELRAGRLPARPGGELRARVRARAQALPRAPPPRRALGLRLSLADRAHAGHRRGLRPADPADLRAFLSHAARAAVAVRPRAASIASSSATTSGTGSTCRWPSAVERMSRWIGLLQQGRIAVYLLYSFLTLVGVLVVVKR